MKFYHYYPTTIFDKIPVVMIEFNVLQWAVLISNGYKYFLFIENGGNQLLNPLELTVKVIPFQKLQDAKSIQSLYDDSVFILKSINDYELIYDMAQGVNGIKYVLDNILDLPKLEIKKALSTVN